MVYLTLLPNQTKLRHEEALSTEWEHSFKHWRYIRHCVSVDIPTHIRTFYLVDKP